tara:strand:+ start:1021 stop:1479 length:459 start_codon:yes stop_codon:yes gene_type:complete
MNNFIDDIYSSFFDEVEKIAAGSVTWVGNHPEARRRRDATSPRKPTKKLPRALKAAYLKAGIDKSESDLILAPYYHEGVLDKYSSDNSYLVTGGPVSGAYYGGLAGLGISAYQMSKLLKEHGPKVKKNILMGLGVGGLAGLLELLSKRKRDR